MRTRHVAVLAFGALALGGCNLDLLNPNSPSKETVLSSREGVVALAIGLQSRFGSSMDNLPISGGLLTDEMGATASALEGTRNSEDGVLSNNADVVAGPWGSYYRTINTANDLLVSARDVALGDSTESGVLALAYLFKAMSIGELLQLYEELPIDTYGNATPQFVNRATALNTVLALLDSALAQYRTVRPGSEFDANIRAPSLDLRNTIFAMQARYYRLRCTSASSPAADCDAAITAADSVSRTTVSFMPFSTTAGNPIAAWRIYVRPLDAFRLAADPGDQRTTGFHVIDVAQQGFKNPLDDFRQFQTSSSPAPFYYPDEMRLIKAEALTYRNRLVEAAAVVDSVRTDCAGPANEPNACQPALTAAVLNTPAALIDEIYKQRRFELFGTGLRWEDARRLGRVGTGDAAAIAKRCWLVYPLSERNTNPNVPADPEPADPPAYPASCS